LGAITDPTKAPGQDEHTQRAALTTSIFISLGRKIAGKVKPLAAPPSKQSAECRVEWGVAVEAVLATKRNCSPLLN